MIECLPAYRPVHDDESRYLVLYGGAGSGKSHYVSQRLIMRCMRQANHRFLIARKVARTCRGSTFQLFLDLITSEPYLQRVTYVRRTDMVIQFANGSEIIHAGLDDAEKLKSIAGITGVWIEEATELTEEDFVQVDLRLRGETPYYKQIVLTFNPIDGRHWLKRRFFDDPLPSTTTLRTTHEHNAFVGDDYRRVLEGLPDDLARVYLQGEWGLPLKGLIYPDWQTVEAMPEGLDVVYGLDFGFNNPTALVRVGWRDGDPADLFVDECLYESHLNDNDLATVLRDLCGDTLIVADAAQPATIDLLRAAGLRVDPADKGQGSVEAGLRFCRGCTLHVTRSSANVMRELQTYRWAEGKDGFTDKPVKFHDHALDAMRYAAHKTYAGGTPWVFQF